MVLQPLCACSTILYFCLILFSRCFCHSRIALFRSIVCHCLISSCVSCCVCHFLWFEFSFLNTIPAINTSCYFLFLFIVFLHISFHTYYFIQKDLGLCGPIMLTRSKGFWAQFALICWSHSTEQLYSMVDLYSAADLHFVADRFPLHFFLWTFLVFWSSWWAFGPCFSSSFPLYGLLSLASYWAFFLMGFLGMDLQKCASTKGMEQKESKEENKKKEENGTKRE